MSHQQEPPPPREDEEDEAGGESEDEGDEEAGGAGAAAPTVHVAVAMSAIEGGGDGKGSRIFIGTKKQNKVHPMPALEMQPPAGARARGRGSVIMGRPDENQPVSARLAARSSSAQAEADDSDEDTAEDKVARSVFHRQRTLVPSTTPQHHRLELLVATFNVLVHLATILTDLLLLSDYSEHGDNISASALALIRILVGLVELEFDYLNRGWRNGRWKYIPLVFCNLRILVDYAHYVRGWWRHRGRPWRHADFRANASFETFIGSLPSLVVQTYVMISDPRPIQDVWIVAYCMTILSASVDLLHHFKYVAVESSIYLAQFVKAIISTGLRMLLMALLLDRIGRIIMAWAVVSLLAGVGVYYIAVRYARAKGRDDPFQYGPKFHHMCLGGLVAGTQMFVAIPFAPSHSIYDWWLGYLLCEVKQAVENVCMLAVVLDALRGEYKEEVFWAVAGFAFSCMVANLVAGYFIHQHVRKYLLARNFYSDTAIVRMFAFFLHYYRRVYYPASIMSHGSAQNHLLYKDREGKLVHKHLEQQHHEQVQRTQTINRLAAENAHAAAATAPAESDPTHPDHSPQQSISLANA